MSHSTRRYRRYKVELPVRLRVGSRQRDLRTEDVSYRGLFARTEDPVVLRQLLVLELSLPPEGTPFRCHGMAVHCIRPGQESGRAPGVGLMFYALDSASKILWEKFIAEVALTAPEIEPARLSALEEPGPGPQVFSHCAARLEVRPRSLDELLALYSRDISKGTAFLETRRPIDAGTALEVAIRHPDLERHFAIEAVVRRRIEGGLGVEFLNLNEARRAEFFEFVCASGLVLDPADFA